MRRPGTAQAVSDRVAACPVAHAGPYPRREPARARGPQAVTGAIAQGAQAGERLAVPLRGDRSGHRSLALMGIDVDGIKHSNADHGSGLEEEVLRIVGLRLGRAVRATDTVTRLGGEGFACLLTGCRDRDQLSRLACTLFDAMATPLMVGDVRLTLLPSIGIATHPGRGVNAEDFMHRADAAMHRAKCASSGYAFCEDTQSA